MDFVSKLEPLARRHEFAQVGVTPLSRPLSMDVYRAWLSEGLHGNMKYLAEHADLKEDSRRLAPRARSAIVLTKSYFPHPYGENPLPGLRTALYARGSDYHSQFRRELEFFAEALRVDYPNEEFLCFTDSAPILERDLAYRAGLGWVGKNTCLIHPKQGSLFFLGQILTSLESNETRAPQADHCGTCDRCITACPTGALEEPRKLNATKCISYWTIETRDMPPSDLVDRFGDWFFGCDICQTVCPWNEKAHGRDLMRGLSAPREDGVEDLRWILTTTNHQLNKELRHTPLSRARPRGLKRNALLVVGNRRLHALRAEVENLLNDAHLNEVARWTLAQLN